MHLPALRALGDDVPVNLKLVVEGSEEQGTGGLEAFVAEQRRPARAPTRSWSATPATPPWASPAATVSLRGMVNVVVTVEALRLRGPLRHVRRRGPRRPRRPGRDAGHPAGRARQHHDQRPGQHQRWTGAPYPPEQFRRRRRTCSRGSRCSATARVSDMLWARPARDDPRHRLPAGGRLGGRHRAEGGRPAEPAHPARACRRRSPRRRSIGAPARRRPWGVARHRGGRGDRLARSGPTTDGPAYRAHGRGDAGGLRRRRWRTLGQGGSIPLCNVFADTYPDAEIILMGVEEPGADPRPQRERRPDGDLRHGADRGAVPPALRRRLELTGT